MKCLTSKYYKVILYTIISLIFVMSVYIIVINIKHYKSLSYVVTVNEADSDYVNYKKNVNEILYNLGKKSNSNLNSTFATLKNGGVFRLIPKTKLTYRDLYELNNYFINDIINNCWFSKLKEINKSDMNNKIIEIIINNSEYLNNHFINNGLTLYDSYDDNMIQDDYYLILKNYLAFSNVILSISKG